MLLCTKTEFLFWNDASLLLGAFYARQFESAADQNKSLHCNLMTDWKAFYYEIKSVFTISRFEASGLKKSKEESASVKISTKSNQIQL